MTLWVGVDPGLEGAVGTLHNGVVRIYDAPIIEKLTGRKTKKGNPQVSKKYIVTAAWTIVRNIQVEAGDDKIEVAIENVHAMPKQGVVSAFNFGRGSMLWEALFVAIDVKPELVTPQKWKRLSMPLMPKGLTKARQKTYARKQFAARYPDLADLVELAKHDGRAESVLIAEYLRKMNGE